MHMQLRQSGVKALGEVTIKPVFPLSGIQALGNCLLAIKSLMQIRSGILPWYKCHRVFSPGINVICPYLRLYSPPYIICISPCGVMPFVSVIAADQHALAPRIDRKVLYCCSCFFPLRVPVFIRTTHIGLAINGSFSDQVITKKKTLSLRWRCYPQARAWGRRSGPGRFSRINQMPQTRSKAWLPKD